MFGQKKEKKIKKKPETLQEKIIDNVKVFFSAYAIAFVIRLVVIEAYQIPSQSMVPSLLVGDTLMVNKIAYGGYIPVLGIKLPGVEKPQRNDVVVFVSPEWKNPGKVPELITLLSLSLVNLDNTFDNPKNLVKRLVGLPGDKISMTNRMLTINGNAVPTEYMVSVQQPVLDRKQVVGNQVFDQYIETVNGKKRVVQHAAGNHFLGMNEIYQFPEIKVPVKGEVISLSTNVNNVYYLGLIKLLIEHETGKMISIANGNFVLDGNMITEWKIKQNYYFCMGDNRDFSYDCRYFGFVPENRIYGTPLFRYLPFNRIGYDVNEKIIK